jgi:hypothetical protein
VVVVVNVTAGVAGGRWPVLLYLAPETTLVEDVKSRPKPLFPSKLDPSPL